MSAQAAIEKKHYTFEEYIQLEEKTGIRHEYHDGEVFAMADDVESGKGEVFAMAGGTKNHNYVAHNINSLLNSTFKSKGCRSFQENVKLEIDNGTQYIYPDILFSCSPEDLDAGFSVKNPVLIAEIISPSSETDDRGRKWRLYRRIASLRYYLLISQQQPYVELYSRKHTTALFQLQEFSSLEDIIHFPDLDFSISLQQIYDGIRFPAV
jgi:Uma2 family endonuclease